MDTKIKRWKTKKKIQVEREPISVSVAEALRIVPIGKSRLYEAIRRGEIKSKKALGIRIIDVASLKEVFGFEPNMEKTG